MSRIAAQKRVPVAKTVSDHAPPGPVLLAQRLKRERRRHAEDLSDASIAIGRHTPPEFHKVVDQPPFTAVDREHEGAPARADTVDGPGGIRCTDVSRLYLHQGG